MLRDVLAELFNGVLGVDYMAAYQKYASDVGIVFQLCLAHLVRNVRYLITLPDKVTQNYGYRVAEALRILFHAFHRREKFTPSKYERTMRMAMVGLIATARHASQRTEAQKIATCLRENGE